MHIFGDGTISKTKLARNQLVVARLYLATGIHVICIFFPIYCTYMIYDATYDM